MTLPYTRLLTFGAVLLTAANCSFVDETLLPALTGDEPASKSATEGEVAKAATVVPTPAPDGSNPYELAAPAPGQTTGTEVGADVTAIRERLAALQQRINENSGNFAKLQSNTAQNLESYYGTTAAINTRLQLGTTKSNPELVAQLDEARKNVGQIEEDISKVEGLSAQIATDTRETEVILADIQTAFEKPGAIDEDHRQLTILEGEASRANVLTKRLEGQMKASVQRQAPYVDLETTNLAKLETAIANGGFVEEGETAIAAAPAPSPSSGADTATKGERPALVIIRFDEEDVAYEQPLFEAVSKAMEARPQSSFDVVSISPLSSAGGVSDAQAQSFENAGRVLQSLTDMGLPPSRINLSTASNSEITSNEVRIYVQ